MKYPQERKEAVLKKMLPPHSKHIPEIAKEENISEATLYNWRKSARSEGCKACSLSDNCSASLSTGMMMLRSKFMFIVLSYQVPRRQA
ncbi:transposase [Methylicorpusculum sp.]|uniref:transposase n=1 Tax=Methylicorpusculum sp. TaxID=2713644 RepID=UPI003A0FFB30